MANFIVTALLMLQLHSVPAQVFADGNAAYAAGDYARAVTLYQQLLSEQGDSAPVYYNLGNSYVRLGQLGAAIAAYRQAQRLEPRQEDIAANLTFVRHKVQDALPPSSGNTLLNMLFFWHHGLSVSELAWGTALLNVLFWSLFSMYRFYTRNEIVRWLTLFVGMAVVALGGSWAVHALWPSHVAVVTTAEADVHGATSFDSIVRFKLHDGAEISAVDQEKDWIKIRLPDGTLGWISASNVQLL